MLSEKIVEELARNTPLSERLITEAWPDLSTESRLQIIQASVDAHLGSAPIWLSILAVKDEAPIVRWWAARLTLFKRPPPADGGEGAQDPFAFLFANTDDERQLVARAKADPSDLVQVCADMGDTLSYGTLSTSTQFRRLAFLRGLTMRDLGSFVQWLDMAVDADVPDQELGECAEEFFALPRVQRDLKRDPDDFRDGMDAYHAGKGIETGWRVVKKAGPILQRNLMYVMPTRMGLGRITPDELAQMPEAVLSAFPYRSDQSKEIAAVIALMREHPERFPEEAIRSLERADEYGSVSAAQMAQARAKDAVDRSQAILDTLIELHEKVAELGEQIQRLQVEAASRKRGFFG